MRVLSKKVLYYINQFFGQIGGEEMAHVAPTFDEKAVGPAMGFERSLGQDAKVVGTIICGDNFFNENLDESLKFIKEVMDKVNPDIVVAGPAFNAGRYGMACAGVAKFVTENYNAPVVTGMYEENPGLDACKSIAYVVPTGNVASSMGKALPIMAKLTLKLLKGEVVKPLVDGYFAQGKRLTVLSEKIGAIRATEMLMKRLRGEEFETELPMPVFDKVEPAKAIVDLSKATIAVVTSGGIVPLGNPDKIQSASAQKWGKYDISALNELGKDYCTIHGGYDPVYANEKPDRVAPVDILKEMEKEGKIGKVYKYFYTTTGTGTAVGNSIKFGVEIGKELKEAGVDGVILTSTWGTCTRCGATIVKEIERYGIPIVHMATIVTISKSVGANRIVPTVAIPYPVGNASLEKDKEYAVRRDLVERAVDSLATTIEEATFF